MVGVFTALGIAGSLVGSALSGRIYQRTLKRLFAGFLVVMATYILVRQAPRVFPDAFRTQRVRSQLEPVAAEPPRMLVSESPATPAN